MPHLPGEKILQGKKSCSVADQKIQAAHEATHGKARICRQ